MIHWLQCVRTATFQKFDYGNRGNIDHYGQPTPPPYQIQNFPAKLPLVIVTGGIDALADPSDVQILLSQLPVPPVAILNRPDYGHLDPLLGIDADKLTYPDVLAQLAKFHSRR